MINNNNKSFKRPWKVSTYFGTFIILIILNSTGISLIATSTITRLSTERSLEDLLITAKTLNHFFPYQTVDSYHQANNHLMIESFCQLKQPENKLRITVIAPDGTVEGDSIRSPILMDNHNDRSEVIDARTNGEGKSIRFSASTGKNLIYRAILIYPNQPDGPVLRLSIPQANLNPLLTTSNLNIFFVTLIMTSIAVLMVILLTVRIARPLFQLSQTASFYAEGDFSRKSYIDHPWELKKLSKALNRMADKLMQRFSIINSQKNELETVINSINDSLILLNSNLKIKKINHKATILLKSTERELRNRPIIELIQHTDIYDFCKESINSDKREFSRDFQLDKENLTRPIKPDLFSGNHSAIRIHLTRFEMPDGDSHLLLIIRDLTRLRKLQQIRTEFISNLSHELKTPVTSISGYAEILTQKQKPTLEKQEEFLTRIHNNAIRLTDITDNILTLSRIESQDSDNLKKEECWPAPLITHALKSIQRDYPDVIIDFSLTEEEPSQSFLADNGLALMAFINLIENGIRYRIDDKRAIIAASIQRVQVKGKNHFSNQAKISISDEGMGINQDEHSRIFERFYRTDRARTAFQKGTGLGLSIVKQIMHAHGGSVELESTPGKGSTFSLYFPLHEQGK